MTVSRAKPCLTLTNSYREMLGTNRKSVTLAAQALQTAGLISYRRGKIQVVDRAGLEKASCECYDIVKQRFDAFLKLRIPMISPGCTDMISPRIPR